MMRKLLMQMYCHVFRTCRFCSSHQIQMKIALPRIGRLISHDPIERKRLDCALRSVKHKIEVCRTNRLATAIDLKNKRSTSDLQEYSSELNETLLAMRT